YYRDGRGIIGNMSVREAFQMAADLGVTTLVPMHWDLFAPNSVPREELALLYELLRPPFRLVLNPASV
ncbi:MAG: MBL fold metallo-hydrolase, partial [Vicinamibacterales bacterium]